MCEKYLINNLSNYKIEFASAHSSIIHGFDRFWTDEKGYIVEKKIGNQDMLQRRTCTHLFKLASRFEYTTANCNK